MLTTDALTQLRQLKQQIQDQKVQTRGTVRGTQGRFGFVVLDDGREIYLAAEQMQRVFPDDCVEIEIITGADGKHTAQLEKLVRTELRDFTGQYVIRDNAHFVEPDLPRLSRWIFVPPKLRMSAKHGDFVRARISHHPFEDGRSQARIEKIIGDANQKGIEANYALTRFRIQDCALPLAESDLQAPDFASRRDLTHLSFVTIDGFETRDMDDALYAERIGNGVGALDGWKLSVAIADPSAWIKPGSPLEQAIAARGSSVYLPGLTIAMLPENLANERCSLQPDSERLALVCELHIDNSGKITHYEFSEARIRSCAKLSYDAVAEFLRGTATHQQIWENSVRELHALAQCLQQRRAQDYIVLPERAEYRARLDDTGKVSHYLRQEKNTAQQLVEECMIGANRCAADFLRNESALFVTHRGFRPEKLENVTRLLNEQSPELAANDVRTLDGYKTLMQQLATLEHPLPLREILFRSLERSQFGAAPAPHFGMGLPAYTTVTSPIRKFNDYILQRAIKAKLRGENIESISEALIAQVQDCSDRARQASNLTQQWLDCVYLQRQLQAKPQDAQSEQQPAPIFRGEIVHVTSSGIVVRLLDNGIQGLVDTRSSGEKFSFDSVYMRLSSPTQQFELMQQVDVTVAAIDMKKRAINFRIATPAALNISSE